MRTPLLAVSLLALGTGLMAQEDPFPASSPSRPMERRTQPRPAPKPVEGEAQEQAGQPQPQAQEERAARPDLDRHYLMKDEYLIIPDGYKAGSGWAHVYIGKMVTPPTAETKQEGEFFIINSHKKGEKIWTKHFSLTRPATREDLKLGTVVYALDGNNEEDNYVGPKSREDNLNHTWFVGTINDDSNLYKGYLTMSGYKVKPGAMRIAIKK